MQHAVTGASSKGVKRTAAPVLFGAALLIVSFNLRPAIASVSPLLGTVRRAAHLSPVAAGILTTLPLVCFGALAFVAPRLVRRVGAGSLLLVCLVVLTGATVLRSVASDVALFGGTLAIGVGVAVANVLMPGIVKQDFGGHVGLVMGLYTMALSAGPAVATGSSVPLAHLLGSWRLALAFWALPAALGVLVWLPFRRHDRPAPARPNSEAQVRIPWRDPVAGAVTLYMGLQSLSFYAILAWLPTILHDRGTSVVGAGLLLALVNVVGIVSALVTPVLTNRMRDERAATVASTTSLALGIAGLLLDPRHLDVLWAVLLGIGEGSAISLALLMMVVRARSTLQATALSGLAQGFGYLIAAAGPALAGALYGASGSWNAPLALLLVLLVPQFAAGWRGGHGLLREAAVVPGVAAGEG